MARLLKRVRGEDDPGAPRPQRTEAVYAPPPRASDAAAKPSPAQQAKQISINIVEPDSQPGEYLPRSQAPELTTNLKAMRELANESARTAIHTSVRKRGGASAMGRFFVAVAALIIGGMLIWLSPSFTSLTAYGAAASLVIGLLFAARGLADVRRYRSALRSRPSAQPRDAAVDPPAVEAPQDGTLSDDAPQVGD
jgi:hypothetical protein